MNEPIRNIFARHEVVALQFSGGKDSLACLWLLEPFWSRLTVLWANAGDAFPETLELMRNVRALVPNFREVKSDVRAQQAEWGFPVDVLPVRNHPGVAKLMHPHPRPKLQSCVACCAENLWQPMVSAVKELGATLIIRGQRKAEIQRTPLHSGSIVEGVEYLFPIENWSSDEVRLYLDDKPIGLPENYEVMDTGLDCMHCTGHLFENVGKRIYMVKRHPEAYAEVSRRLDVIADWVERDMRHLHDARRAGEPTQ